MQSRRLKHLNNLFRNNAEEALQKLNGTMIGKQTVRLSWGRNPAYKQAISLSLYFSYHLLIIFFEVLEYQIVRTLSCHEIEFVLILS